MLSRFLALVLLPLFTRYLTPQDYGISALVGIITLALTGIFSLGTGNSMAICFFESDQDLERHAVVWTTALTVLLNSAWWCLLGLILAPWIGEFVLRTPGYDYVIRLALVSLAVSTIWTPFLSYLRLTERARHVVAITLTSTATALGLSVLFIVHLGRGLKGLFEANALAQALTLLLAFVTVAPRLRYGIRWRLMPTLIRVGFPSTIGLGAFYVVDYADRALLQWFAGVTEVGLYALGYSFGLIMLVAVDAFASGWPPYFISFLNRRDEAATIFGHVLRYYLVVYGGMVLLFFAFARPVIRIMTAPEFHSAYTVVGLVAAAYMLKGCYLILLPGITFAKKLGLQSAIEWAAAGLTIGLNVLLIPALKKEGAALATGLAYLSLPVLAYFASRKYLAVHYNWPCISRWSGAFLGSALLLTYLNSTGNFALQIPIAILVLALYSIFVFYAVLTPTERTSALRLLFGRNLR